MTAINRLKRVPMISAGLIPTSRHCDNLAPFRLARNVATALMKKKAINQGTCITTVPNLKFNQTKGRGPTLLSTTRDRRAARTPAMTRALMVCVRGTHTHGQIGSNANIGGGAFARMPLGRPSLTTPAVTMLLRKRRRGSSTSNRRSVRAIQWHGGSEAAAPVDRRGF
jgi:hypothetical protein